MNPSTLNHTRTPKLSPSGRPYIGVGCFDLGQPSKWVKGVEKRPFVYLFRYTDDGSLFGFEYGYNFEFIKKWVHSDCREFLDNLSKE